MNPRSGSTVLVPLPRPSTPSQEEDDTDVLTVQNPNITRDKEDVLYHLGLSNLGHYLPAMFSDVRFVCMGGSAVRAERLAHQIADRLGISIPTGMDLSAVGKTERFSLFKVGPIISVNHGMGMPSMSILLHEVTKLLFHSKVKTVNYIRIGTSGGVGVPGGTVVVTSEGDDGKQEKIECIAGKTIGTDDFYEGQARLDGAEVCYDANERLEWLTAAYEKGVRNIEMESTCFAAWCHRTKIPGMICCAVLLNRLEGDQVTATSSQLQEYSKNAQEVALRVIEHKLKLGI